MSKKKQQDVSADFETSMSELEGLVESMETDSLSLEESLKTFEKGIQLTRVCQKALADAEHEIKILMGDKEVDFEPTKP